MYCIGEGDKIMAIVIRYISASVYRRNPVVDLSDRTSPVRAARCRRLLIVRQNEYMPLDRLVD